MKPEEDANNALGEQDYKKEVGKLEIYYSAENSGKKKRRRRLKTDSTEISQYEEVVHSSTNQNSGNVIYEETVPMSESEQV